MLADIPLGPDAGCDGATDTSLADIPLGPDAGIAMLALIPLGPDAGIAMLALIPLGPLIGGHAAPDEWHAWFNGRGFVLLESQVQSIRDTVVALDPHLEVRGIGLRF